MSDEVQVVDRGPVRWLVVDRYERRNAWTFAMGAQLDRLLDEAAADPGVGALVVFGAGGAFSAGIDRADLASGVRASPMPVEKYVRFAKPTIACVDGLAFGMGFTLAVASDLRVASARATFTFGFGGLGLIPEFASTFMLWRQVGWSRALDLSLTNRTVGAEEALAMGLVDRLAGPDEVEDTAQALAEQIASLPPGTAEATKALWWASVEQSTLSGARAVELRAMYELRMKMAADGVTPAARSLARPGGPAAPGDGSR